MSYSSSVVRVQWKRRCITPVPKTAQPVTCADYRHISVTPVLSRVMERLTVFVRRDLYPVLVHPDFSNLFCDQFAFRHTGSTTAALVFLFHHLSHMPQDHKSVHLIALDFSKAFYTVRHSTLAAKISSFPISDNVYNWIVNFLSDSQHQTRANDSRSYFKSINASIIQGSGLGPVAYILNASDLCSAHQSNLIFKYADDLSFLLLTCNYTIGNATHL